MKNFTNPQLAPPSLSLEIEGACYNEDLNHERYREQSRVSGPTDGAAAGVAASGDQTEGAEGEDNKEASISSRAPAH